VLAEFPHIKTLSDFEEHPNDVPRLLAVMKRYTAAPSHNTLGYVGGEHFKARFEEYYGGDLSYFEHKKITGILPGFAGMPYVFEFAIAELSEFAPWGSYSWG
jgi:hypothetical protein